MEQLPIPDASESERQAIAASAEKCCAVGRERYEVLTAVQRRLMKTFGEDAVGKPLGALNTKAKAWSEFSCNELGSALKASFKLKQSPFKNPRVADEWEPYIDEKRAEVARLTKEISDAEAELNDRVFRLFSLTSEEIRLLQKEVEH